MLDKSVFAFNARQSIKLISWVVLLATHIMWQTQWQCLPEISAKLFGIVVCRSGVMKIIKNLMTYHKIASNIEKCLYIFFVFMYLCFLHFLFYDLP